MKKYLLALAILFGSIAGAALVAKALTSNADAVALLEDADEPAPAWAHCGISLDCLRL
jgi:hypothetical protein